MGSRRGFTLIELLVVVAVIALLASIAIPSYLNQTRKSRRNAAEGALHQIALLEERYRADNPGFLTANSQATWAQLGMADPSGKYFTFTVLATNASGGTPASYAVQATAKGDQTKDKSQGTTCSPLKYELVYDSVNNVLNTSKSPSACWAD